MGWHISWEFNICSTEKLLGSVEGSHNRLLGRALSFYPSVLLLDEPLSALDADTRNEMQELLKSLADCMTTLHITHNQEEAKAG